MKPGLQPKADQPLAEKSGERKKSELKLGRKEKAPGRGFLYY